MEEQYMILENDKVAVKILQRLGGKIVSFMHKDKGFDFVSQNQTGTYGMPGKEADFSKFDASGLDDAYPNIDQEVLEYEGRTLRYPDHGEIWSHIMTSHGNEGGKNRESVRLIFQSDSFPYAYEKQFVLKESVLEISYFIENTADWAFPCIWTFHGLFRYEEDMELFYPEGITGFLNVLESPQLGQAGTSYSMDNTVYNFRKVPSADSHTMVKYYGEGYVREGRCGIKYPSDGVMCTLLYDAEKLPYLGVWMTAGGYRGDYNLALEPSNGFYDKISIAEQNGRLFVLEPGKPLTFVLKIQVSEINQ